MQISSGWLQNVNLCLSSHHDERPTGDISLLVIHNISLPPGQFGGEYVQPFFQGKLDPAVHPFFEEIASMRVSAHCFINRAGEITQFVSFDNRAWHAGLSSFQGRKKCNDFSIGIELEGCDDVAYSESQYSSLSRVTKALMVQYPAISLGRIVGHNDIAPGRKTDPGQSFDWGRFRRLITSKES